MKEHRVGYVRVRQRLRPGPGALVRTGTSNGKDALFLAGAGVPGERAWAMRRERKSPAYTTRWDELLTVEAG